MEEKEKLDPIEQAKKTIAHFLNDFDKYPDIRLNDAEKVDQDKKLSKADPTLLKRLDKWRHNKYSVTWWFAPVIGNIGLILEDGKAIPEQKKAELELKFQELRARVYKEQREDQITEEAVDMADDLLKDIKNAL